MDRSTLTVSLLSSSSLAISPTTMKSRAFLPIVDKSTFGANFSAGARYVATDCKSGFSLTQVRATFRSITSLGCVHLTQLQEK